ncbi:tryptophan-rich sensory protein [Nocardioides sp. zg-536]|uniref:Tryptophan-rich sensory protein n=1 Tax=Nocardioides faecalis TaxID=2803858 RepID=A0A938Y376_9ACTN|nr:TspO/MBR family protein [Nocardioides faecalis]MBM9458429.1 tryptophan-rich sensory protein [Nocardioides faecalis]QVI58444.1 tryptophan-rich sensory protein [Nocardioides faecalis]
MASDTLLGTRVRRADLVALAVVVLLVVAAAGFGSLAAQDSRSTYDNLDTPPFAPPGWLFGPMWSLLYLLIALSAWLTWLAVRRVDVALGTWLVQLVLNAAWTPLFFGGDKYWIAFVELCALVVAIVATIVLFVRRRRLAGVLLLPYLGWVGYAGALNLAIALAN